MRPHIIDASGRVRLPFVYPLRLENRLEHRYVEDRSRPMPLRLFRDGALLSVDPVARSPWFPLGTDALGRDELARLAWGTRLSLGVALGAALGALVIGAIVGGMAGFAGGLVDDGLMRVADVIIALPAVYVVLALRASMPLVLTTTEVFWTMVVVLAVVGWPFPARGVRAIVAVERTRGVRRSCARAGGEPYAVIAASPAAGRARVPGRADHAARAGLRPRRGDAVVRGAGLQRADPELGRDAAGSRTRPGARRCAVAPGAGGRDRPRRRWP